MRVQIVIGLGLGREIGLCIQVGVGCEIGLRILVGVGVKVVIGLQIVVDVDFRTLGYNLSLTMKQPATFQAHFGLIPQFQKIIEKYLNCSSIS